MANEVLIAHTGQRLRVDFAQFASLDDFKSVVSRQTSIPPDCIIALTPDGKPLRLAALQTEIEIYVYDARTAQRNDAGAAATAHLEIPLPKRPSVTNPPNGLRDQRSLAAWQELFEARKTWASELETECAAKAAAAQERYAEMDAMMRCLDAAVANLEAVVKGVENKYTDVRKWVDSAQADYSDLVAHWEQYLQLARSIVISPAMLQFMTGTAAAAPRSGRSGQTGQPPTLEDLVDTETARKAGKLAAGALRRFQGKAAELARTAPRLFQGCAAVLGGFERTVERSALSHAGEPAQLLADLRAVAGKIGTDYATTLGFTADAPRDVLQASKIAATHTERLLPSIRARALEMGEMQRYATQARNALAREAVEVMRTITELTSLSSEVKAQMAAVSTDDDHDGDMAHFDYLRLVQQIPYVYASFVGEAIRRREWVDKVKTDASTLANEMALFHDEEVKRRKKWQKSVANLAYGPAAAAAAGEHQVAGLEINLLGDEAEWPAVARKDLEAFHGALQRQKADAALVADVGKMVAELSAPTKQQARRIKGFKNGSMHEGAGPSGAAILGRSGLLIRGDDDVLRSLQEDKGRLENKLKTAESRVRRLEDLLHRQSQASRASLGGLFSPSQQLSDRRVSLDGGQGSEVSSSVAAAAAAQRIQSLEADLAAERQRTEVLGRDLQTRTVEQTDMRTRMDETNSTKKDLLENLEALKREFTGERKSLEAEIKRLQARLDDAEDEMEHAGEAREQEREQEQQERAAYDARVAEREAALEAEARAARDEVLKTQGQVDFLTRETRQQREQADALLKAVQAKEAEADELRKALQTKEELLQTARAAEEQHAQAWQQLQEQLFGTDSPTPETADLIEVVSGKVADLLGLQEQLDKEQKRTKELAAELATCRDELKASRDELARHKAEAEAGAQNETNATAVRHKLAEAETTVATLTARLEARTQRTQDVSQRLCAQHERTVRLLERLGFAVSRAGESTVITRVPRAERSAVLGESMRKSGAGEEGGGEAATTDAATSEETTTLTDVLWTDDDAETETAHFAAYLAAVGSLDMDLVAETIARRVKEVEHVARKLQRDVRSYRDKAHAYQKEAQGKIAFRHFKEGDLALFLPTRNQTNGAWAAFNIGFPHYFLREQEQHRLQKREWLVARITRVQERVVDLSKGPATATATAAAPADNPFDLSDGLRWYLIDAQEDKPGAPSTPGLGKSTVAANHVEAVADMHSHAHAHARQGSESRAGVLSRSLESRRSSTSSRKASPLAAAAALRNTAAAAAAVVAAATGSAGGSETSSLRAAAAATTPASASTPAAAPATETTTTPETVATLQRGESADSQSRRSVVWEALWP